MPRWKWIGPFKIESLLTNCINDNQPWPPANKAVYIVSVKRWKGRPGRNCSPLYIGGNTSNSDRFCTRIGDLIADMYGFFNGNTGHHSGGKALFNWCKSKHVHPKSLFIGWGNRSPWCNRCAEIELVISVINNWDNRAQEGLLNQRRPPQCTLHDRMVE